MLKILKLRKLKELKEEQLREVISKIEGYQTRSVELENKISDSNSEEELEKIEKDIENLETEKNEANEEKSGLEEEIEKIDSEIQELEERTKKTKKEKEENKGFEKLERGVNMGTKMNEKIYLRELLKLEHIRTFFDDVANILKRKKGEESFSKVEITIPKEIVEIITDDLGNYSVLYNEVRVEKLNGAGRIIISGKVPPAIWCEMTGSINELKFGFSDVEVDGFKLAGFFKLHNSHMEDSMVDLADMVIKLLKESIGIALDMAILYGEGATKKQPEGIITNYKAKYSSEVVKTAKGKTTLADFLIAKSNLDRGVSNLGEVIYVMNEKTWTSRVLTLSISSNNAGAYVTAATGKMPASGDRVVICNILQDDVVVIGDFQKYALAQRNEMSIVRSDEIGFYEDQTVFKGTQRFDGKPYRLKAFTYMLLEGKSDIDPVTFPEDVANKTDEEA